MDEHDAEVISVGVNAGLAVIVQLMQAMFALAAMYGLDSAKLQELLLAEKILFNANTPDKLPDAPPGVDGDV